MRFITLTALLLVAVLAVSAMPERRSPPEDVGLPEAAEDRPALEDPAGDNAGGDDNGDDGDKKKRWVWNTVTYDDEPSDFLSEGGTGKAGGCSAKYKALTTSTMCFYNDDSSVTQWGMSKAEMDDFVNMHNSYRAKENAKNMLKMYWDPKLATLAQKLAQSCTYNHDSGANRFEPTYKYSGGQNICMASSAEKCTDLWFGEKSAWKFGGPNVFDNVGHFTQGVQSKAIALGCGHAKCNGGSKDVYVCNYSYIQLSGDVDTPYEKGTKCASCPGKCKNNLCDCGHKMCKNGGTVNVATCGCDCPKPYIGSTCQNVDCTNVSQCNSGLYVKANCNKYSDLPGLCPKMCDLC